MTAPQGPGRLPDAELDRLADEAGAEHGIDPALIRAVIEAESGGDPTATRFEPNWNYHLDYRTHSRLVSSATERAQQATSWGLMQVMGTVARERGFDGPFLAALCAPETGVWYGAAQLARLLRRYDGDAQDAVAAYNAGSPRRADSGEYVNQWYVDRVCGAQG